MWTLSTVCTEGGQDRARQDKAGWGRDIKNDSNAAPWYGLRYVVDIRKQPNNRTSQTCTGQSLSPHSYDTQTKHNAQSTKHNTHLTTPVPVWLPSRNGTKLQTAQSLMWPTLILPCLASESRVNDLCCSPVYASFLRAVRFPRVVKTTRYFSHDDLCRILLM